MVRRRFAAAGLLAAALAGACAGGPERGPAVLATAAPDPGGLRVRFQRTRPGTAGYLAGPEADGGSITEVVHSPDHLSLSFLWRDRSGEVRCRFPYGGVGRFAAGGDVDPGRIEYVFLEDEGVRVTAEVPRGCPILPFVDLRIHVDPGGLPAGIRFPDGRSEVLHGEDNRVRWRLPATPEGVLAGGDHELVLLAAGRDRLLLLSIDADGALAAPCGFVQNW
jgi:hypothetical protein